MAAQGSHGGEAVCFAEGVAEDGDIPDGGREAAEGFCETRQVPHLKAGSGKEAVAALHQRAVVSNLEGFRHKEDPGRGICPGACL